MILLNVNLYITGYSMDHGIMVMILYSIINLSSKLYKYKH